MLSFKRLFVLVSVGTPIDALRRNKQSKFLEAFRYIEMKKTIDAGASANAVDCTSDAFVVAYAKTKSKTSDGDDRVTKDDFVKYFKATNFGSSVKADLKTKYESYLKKVFDTFLAMMPHTSKKTLGRHCFRSAAHLVEEFYATGQNGFCATKPYPSDSSRGAGCKIDVGADFAAVNKTKEVNGRVAKEEFVQYYLKSDFAKKVSEDNQEAYKKYLGMLHDIGYQMMPLGKSGDDKNTLGKHCFEAVARWTVDFYATTDGGYCTSYE